jgi:hypothetical protein
MIYPHFPCVTIWIVCKWGGEEIKVSSLWELKHKAYEMMIYCLQFYQGQVEEVIEEFQDGTRTFYCANEEYVLHWQGESREAYELVYGDLQPIEVHIDANEDDLLYEKSREIAQIRRKIEELQ